MSDWAELIDSLKVKRPPAGSKSIGELLALTGLGYSALLASMQSKVASGEMESGLFRGESGRQERYYWPKVKSEAASCSGSLKKPTTR